MRKFYESVRVDNKGTDEWTLWEGYDREEALRQSEYHRRYDHCSHTETHEYTLPDERDFDELSDYEQCEVLSSYNIID